MLNRRTLDLGETLTALRGFAGDWVDIHIGVAHGEPSVGVFLRGRLFVAPDRAPELGLYLFGVEEADEVERRRRGSAALVVDRQAFERGELIVDSGVLWVFQGQLSYAISRFREESPGDRIAIVERLLAKADGRP